MPARSNNSRNDAAYSSPPLSRSVGSRHCANSSASRKTPSLTFVFPASITRSISEFPVWIAGQDLFDQIRGSAWSVFLFQLSADLDRAASVRWLVKQFVKFVCDARRTIVITIKRPAGAELVSVFGVV